MRRRFSRERASIFLEMVIAFCILTALLLPLLGNLGTGIRQTHTIKTQIAANSVAQYALAFGRQTIATGGAGEGSINLTAQSAAAIEGATVLQNLSVSLILSRLGGSDSKLWRISTEVTWNDPYIHSDRRLTLDTIDRSEL